MTGSSSEGKPEGAGGNLMAQFLAANTRLSNSVKSRHMRPTSRTIAALSAAIVTGFAVSAIGAPVAVAQFCINDQVWLNGECTAPPGDSGAPAAPKLITESGPAGSSITRIENGQPVR
jgi:hypothetical protein